MSSKDSTPDVSDLPNEKSPQGSHIILEDRYYLKTLKELYELYNIYDGIDINKAKWVNIYVKPNSGKDSFSSRIKENLRNQLCPKVLWAGTTKIGKSSYNCQVHQRYGPTLRTMFDHLKTRPSEKDLLHLLLQMLRLIEKMSNMKLVSGQLSPDVIAFDPNPKKSELYLLNCFSLKKRGESGKVKHTKYCSRGMHLGRNIQVKDDLESLCYILIDIYTEGQFLKGKSTVEYKDIKLSENINEFGKKMPAIFIDFYNYVLSINYKDEINFFHWKTYLTRVLTPEFLAQSYGFKLMKSQKSQIADYSIVGQGDMNNLNDKIEMDENLQQSEKEDKIMKLGRVMSNRHFIAKY